MVTLSESSFYSHESPAICATKSTVVMNKYRDNAQK